MNVSIKGNKLTIVMDFNKAGTPSASGKSNVHASTRGNAETEIEVNGRTLVLGLNAYTKA